MHWHTACNDQRKSRIDFVRHNVWCPIKCLHSKRLNCTIGNWLVVFRNCIQIKCIALSIVPFKSSSLFAISYGRKTISWLHQKSIGSLTSITFPVQFKYISKYLNFTLFFVAFWRPLNYRSDRLQNVFICIIYRKHQNQFAFLLDIFTSLHKMIYYFIIIIAIDE